MQGLCQLTKSPQNSGKSFAWRALNADGCKESRRFGAMAGPGTIRGLAG
jgi:hypothetical protein